MLILLILLCLLMPMQTEPTTTTTEPVIQQCKPTPTTQPTTPCTLGTPIMCDENGVIYEWPEGADDWVPTGDTAW